MDELVQTASIHLGNILLLLNLCKPMAEPCTLHFKQPVTDWSHTRVHRCCASAHWLKMEKRPHLPGSTAKANKATANANSPPTLSKASAPLGNPGSHGLHCKNVHVARALRCAVPSAQAASNHSTPLGVPGWRAHTPARDRLSAARWRCADGRRGLRALCARHLAGMPHWRRAIRSFVRPVQLSRAQEALGRLVAHEALIEQSGWADLCRAVGLRTGAVGAIKHRQRGGQNLDGVAHGVCSRGSARGHASGSM